MSGRIEDYALPKGRALVDPLVPCISLYSSAFLAFAHGGWSLL